MRIVQPITFVSYLVVLGLVVIAMGLSCLNYRLSDETLKIIPGKIIKGNIEHNNTLKKLRNNISEYEKQLAELESQISKAYQEGGQLAILPDNTPIKSLNLNKLKLYIKKQLLDYKKIKEKKND